MTPVELLTIERGPYSSFGAKARAIRDAGFTEIEYYRLLNGILDSEEALQFDPLLTNRLRRIRETRGVRR